MKFIAKALVIILVVVVSVPLITYRTVSPCGMLKKELKWRTEHQVEAVGEVAQDRAADYGEDAQQFAEDMSEIVEDVAEGVAAGVATARVQRMSTGQCVSELWRIKTGREPSSAPRAAR